MGCKTLHVGRLAGSDAPPNDRNLVIEVKGKLMRVEAVRRDTLDSTIIVEPYADPGSTAT